MHIIKHFKVMLSLSLVYTLLCGIDAPEYDMPSKDDLEKESRRKWLHELCLKYVEMYLMTGSEVEPLVQQVHELESAMGANGFSCRLEGCDKTYVHHSSRVKYVKLIEIIAMFRQGEIQFLASYCSYVIKT